MNVINYDAGMKNSSAVSLEIFKNPEFGEVRMALINGKPWFVGIDIARIMGYKRPTDAVRDVVPENHRVVVQLSDVQSGLLDHMKSSKIIVIDKEGVSSLVLRSQRISESQKEEMLSLFKLDISLYSRKEIEFREELVDFMSSFGLTVEAQFVVKGYRVDFYIPYLNVAIEYDENEHKHYNYDRERKRERDIIAVLGCQIIRVSDKKSNAYNLGLIAKQILPLISGLRK